MSGPWLSFCELLGGAVGRRLGRIVTGDFKTFEKMHGWTHADKIEELAGDRHESPEYLRGLIEDSHTKEQLQAVADYLNNAKKAGNLNVDTQQILLKKIGAKITQIEDSETLRHLIQAAKEKGATSFDWAADWFHHLC